MKNGKFFFNAKEFEVVTNNGYKIFIHKRTRQFQVLRQIQQHHIEKVDITFNKLTNSIMVVKTNRLNEYGKSINGKGTVISSQKGLTVRVKQKRPPSKWQEPKLTRLVLA